MIVRTRTGSDFGGLMRYLVGKEERVAHVEGMNLLEEGDPRWVLMQMRDTAAMSGRVEKPVYHLSVSCPAEDETTREERLWATKEIIRDLGLEEHQVYFVEHEDTGHDHVHAMVNRVHPREGTVWEDSYDYKQIEETERRIERQMGWEQVTGYHARPEGAAPPTPALTDREAQKRKEDRVPFRKVVRDLVSDDFEEAQSWEELARRLSEEDLRLHFSERGGLVTDGHETTPLSAVGAAYSAHRLSDRFGEDFRHYADRRDEARSREYGGQESARERWGRRKRAEQTRIEQPQDEQPQSEEPRDERSKDDRPEDERLEDERLEDERLRDEQTQEENLQEPQGEHLQESHPQEETSREASPEESPGQEPSEREPAESTSQGEEYELPFRQEVRIRAAPDLLEADTQEELQTRLVTHGLYLEETYLSLDPAVDETVIVTDGEDIAELERVMPRTSRGELSGDLAEAESYKEQALQKRRGWGEELTRREQSLCESILEAARSGEGPEGTTSVERRSSGEENLLEEENLLGVGPEAAQRFFRAGPGSRKRILRRLVEEAGREGSIGPEALIDSLEAETLAEAQRRALLDEEEKELLGRISRLDLSEDWSKPASEGGLSPTEAYRRMPTESQEALQDRLSKDVRDKLVAQARESRREELGPTCEQIEADLQEGRWDRAADTYINQFLSRRRDLRHMLSDEMESKLLQAHARRKEEAQRIYESLSRKPRSAFEEVQGHLEKAARSEGDEFAHAFDNAVRAWTRVSRGLTEEEQTALLRCEKTPFMTKEIAEMMIHNDRYIDRGERLGRESRGEDRSRDRGGHDRGGRDRGGFRR